MRPGREVAIRGLIAVVPASLLAFASTPRMSAAAKSTGTITGVARSTAGQPLGGHSARVRSVRTGDLVATATTSANGSFVPNLDPGSGLRSSTPPAELSARAPSAALKRSSWLPLETTPAPLNSPSRVHVGRVNTCAPRVQHPTYLEVLNHF